MHDGWVERRGQSTVYMEPEEAAGPTPERSLNLVPPRRHCDVTTAFIFLVVLSAYIHIYLYASIVSLCCCSSFFGRHHLLKVPGTSKKKASCHCSVAPRCFMLILPDVGGSRMTCGTSRPLLLLISFPFSFWSTEKKRYTVCI